MKKYFLLILLAFTINCYAQKTGSINFTINITSPSFAGRTVVQNAVQPYTKYTDYNAYWFTKPDGERYVMINGGKNLGIVILRNPDNDADIAYQDSYRGDQLDLEMRYNGSPYSCHPDNDKGPVHIHYNTFTPGELEFTFTGPVTFATGTNTSDYIKGNINGTIHLYRDAMYEKSVVAPNCNCDPTIYASYYNPETGRTPSACENAVLWRVYNALHPAFYPLLNIAITDDGKAKFTEGTIMYRQDHSMVDVTEALETTDACNAANKRRDLVSVDAHTRLFNQDDYKMSFMQSVNTDQFSPKNPADLQANMVKMVKLSDSLYKLVIAKKMSSEEANRQVNAATKAINDSQTGVPDIHQAEVYAHLDVSARVNAQYADPQFYGQLQHNVPGAAFEIYRPSVKYSDGNWSPFIKYIGFGKFNIVKAGDQVKSIAPVVTPGTNKLALFNVVIEIRGGKDLVETATSTINFAAVPALLNNN
ncbi:hypothetical protein [Mucilaginibacter sp.]|uniref:hypothetical protein n=2 Tax=Mucilaginibacter sp. TaxID=1882438 RepID=UPI0025DF5E12|nr:hypothetical protein [Mucilaginibacter sp.]